MKYLLKGVTGAMLVVAIAYGLWQFDGPFRAAERLWQQPWEEAKSNSEFLCREIAGETTNFDDCMDIERKSYLVLQTSFGLPEKEAVELKRRCAEYQYFTPQLRCIQQTLRKVAWEF